MSEQKRGLLGGLRNKLEDFRLLTVRPLIREMKYQFMVKPETHEQSLVLAEIFAGEGLTCAASRVEFTACKTKIEGPRCRLPQTVFPFHPL